MLLFQAKVYAPVYNHASRCDVIQEFDASVQAKNPIEAVEILTEGYAYELGVDFSDIQVVLIS
jgi:hypothetical protein